MQTKLFTETSELRSLMRGAVILPGDTGYDEARKVQNGLFDRRPAAVARCAGVDDVMTAVRFARERNMLVSIRGGGHNVAGSAVNDGGLVIDMSSMKGIHVNPGRRVARVQPGVTWGELDRETQAFGLATPGGNVTTTGVAGLTLGGGMGWLRSKHGLSCDNLLSADMVTAEGHFVTASETENGDLFWGLRGGGGNFGVVTSFEFRLHEVGPTVFVSSPMYPVDMAPAAFRFWREFAEAAPDELSTIALIWSVPPHPAIPAGLHGRPVVILAGVYCGDLEQGEKVVRPLREFSAPLVDLSGPMPYLTVQSMFDPLFPKGDLYYFKSLRLSTLTDAAIDTICDYSMRRPSPRTLIPVWHFGGAVRRAPAGATAYGDRSAPFMLSIDSVWTRPEDSDANLAWSREFWSRMKQHSTGGLYLNFGGFAEEKEALVEAAYGKNYGRLRALKSKYDPDNFFRMNQNIKPESGGA